MKHFLRCAPPLITACAMAVCGWSVLAVEPKVERGTAKFVALDKEKCPAPFRLDDHEFDYQVQWRDVASERFELADVTFPSPVKTPHEQNNTVHCELYRARQVGKRPAVVVLHILGGDFVLARLFCHALNQGGTTALFLKMPYYGPRRVPGLNRRMIAEDPEETVAGMTQAVLDIRRAAAFLASREDVDADQLGILGVSLGGITASLAAEAEPRLNNVCLLLAGGDFPRIALESAEFKKERDRFLASGKDPTTLLEGVRPVDPLTYGELLRDRRVLMLNAKSDEVIPRSCTEALWTAAGKPEIVWLSGGHYTVMRHLPTALMRANQFFATAKMVGRKDE
jgi:cephalosporin-C deacetylase-like acetyl esterase